MALAVSSPRSPSLPAFQTVILPRPEAGGERVVPSSPGGRLQLEFEPGAATVSRRGNDLVFVLDGGGSVVVADFFTVGDVGFPSLGLPGGDIISSMEFFSGHDIDLTPAAGPAPRPASGGTRYEDDPGELLAGVDRLEALEPSSWDREGGDSPSPPPDAGNPSSAAGSRLDGDFGDDGASSADTADIFLFAELDEGERHREIVEDFGLHEDVLRFEGLIDGGTAEALLDQLQASLGAEQGDPGKLSVEAVTEEGLSLSLGGHVIEVHFEEGDRLRADQVTALQSDDMQAQIEVLKLLFSTTG
jgi:hypothetical protein